MCNRRVGSREFAQTMQEVLRIAKQRARDKKRRERLPLGPRLRIQNEIEQRFDVEQEIFIERNNRMENLDNDIERNNGMEDIDNDNNNADNESDNRIESAV